MQRASPHLQAANLLVSMDPTGAYQLVYDGGHIAVREAVLAQLDPPLGRILRPFDRFRRRRNEAEYPAVDPPR